MLPRFSSSLLESFRQPPLRCNCNLTVRRGKRIPAGGTHPPDKSKFDQLTNMKNYVITIIIIGVIGSLVSLLAPEGEGGGLKKHVGLAIGLCVILCFSSPIISLIQSIGEFDAHALVPDIDEVDREEYESIFEAGFSAVEIQNLRDGIAKILDERFGIDASESSVTLNVSTDSSGKRVLDRIFICLYGSAVWKDTGEIERYLTSLFGCEVITAVG